MKILIIGGTGLISTGITSILLERGHTVTHFNRGKSDSTFGNRVTTVVGDRYDHADFAAKIGNLPRFDCVLEMIGYSLADAESLVHLFDGNCGHLIFCSTVDVYAHPASTYPIVESEPFAPTEWDYSQKKAQMERFFQNWQTSSKQPFTVIRPVHTYGENGAILHAFGGGNYHLDRLKKGKPIIVHGDGQSLWSSVHRDDAALAFANAVCNPVAFGKSYHLPGDECVTWNQIHRKVAEGIGAPPPDLVHIPTDLLYAVDKRAHISAINFQYNNSFDATAAKRDLGFQYTVSIADGARRIYEQAVATGKLTDSDTVPEDDRILDAWNRLSQSMKEDLAGG